MALKNTTVTYSPGLFVDVTNVPDANRVAVELRDGSEVVLRAIKPVDASLPATRLHLIQYESLENTIFPKLYRIFARCEKVDTSGNVTENSAYAEMDVTLSLDEVTKLKAEARRRVSKALSNFQMSLQDHGDRIGKLENANLATVQIVDAFKKEFDKKLDGKADKGSAPSPAPTPRAKKSQNWRNIGVIVGGILLLLLLLFLLASVAGWLPRFGSPTSGGISTPVGVNRTSAGVVIPDKMGAGDIDVSSSTNVAVNVYANAHGQMHIYRGVGPSTNEVVQKTEEVRIIPPPKIKATEPKIKGSDTLAWDRPTRTIMVPLDDERVFEKRHLVEVPLRPGETLAIIANPRFQDGRYHRITRQYVEHYVDILPQREDTWVRLKPGVGPITLPIWVEKLN